MYNFNLLITKHFISPITLAWIKNIYSGLCVTLPLSYLGLYVIWIMCLLDYMYYGLCVSWTICHLDYMSSGLYVFWTICLLDYMSSGLYVSGSCVAGSCVIGSYVAQPFQGPKFIKFKGKCGLANYSLTFSLCPQPLSWQSSPSPVAAGQGDVAQPRDSRNCPTNISHHFASEIIVQPVPAGQVDTGD